MFTQEQLQNGDASCTLPFTDVPAYSVVEWRADNSQFPYCDCSASCNYLNIKSFSQDVDLCLLANERSYGYRKISSGITMTVWSVNNADLLFNVSYRGENVQMEIECYDTGYLLPKCIGSTISVCGLRLVTKDCRSEDLACTMGILDHP